MPEVEQMDTAGFSLEPLPQKPEAEAPSFLTQTVPADFRLENDVFNLYELVKRQQNPFTPQPGFDPGAKLREMDTANRSALWETHGKDFIGVRSEDEFQSVLGRIQRNEADQHILSRSGAGGFRAAGSGRHQVDIR
jgi:hypothetical protein